MTSSLSLDVEYLFWLVQVFFVDGCSAVSCDFGVFMREGECKFFYSDILFPAQLHRFLVKVGLHVFPCKLSDVLNCNFLFCKALRND